MEDKTGVPVTPRLGGRQRLGDYEILSAAGSGGMGLVYRARQRSLGRVVALKVIRDEVARAPEYRERFMREPRLAASVDHPHIVSVFEVGEDDERLFLAMQWIDGEDLKSAIRRQGRLGPDRAVRISTQLASALHAVHSTAGLIHRDVKPANVLIRQVRGGDHAYLTDFGIAKMAGGGDQLTQPGGVVGTPGYMSPEQIRGSEPGPQSDLYALGCVFYEALTGQPPFQGGSDMALMWAHASDPRPVPSAVVPGLGDRYDYFVSVALAINPAERFESGDAFADALDALHPTKVAPQPTSPPHPIIVGPDTPVPPAAATNQPARAATTAQSPPPAPTPPEPPAASSPETPSAYTPPTTPQAPPPTPPHTPPSAPQPTPVAYPPYGYATPPPPAPPSGGGNRLALIVLGLVALAGLAVGALAAGGVFSQKSSTRTITTVTNAGQTTSGALSGTAVSKTSTSASTPTSGGAVTGTTACGGGLSVGRDTSCGFAQNVVQGYDLTAGGSQVVTAYSPATGHVYTIDCAGGSSVVCTGGTTVGASIYFTYAPASQTGTGSGAKLTACDPNISVDAVTSCPFAENVFKAYADQYHGNGGQTNAVVSASSPLTHQTYSMNCTEAGGTVTCTGGVHSYVTFPLHAAQVY